MDDHDEQPAIIPPPPPPTEQIQSALFMPLASLTKEHGGRKIRIVGQILGFDAPTCILLVAAPSTSVQSSQVSTLLVDLSMLFLGQSPFAKDLYAEQDGYRSSSFATSTDTQARTAVLVNREKLSLAPGEFVCIVGWLEGEITKSTPKVTATDTYAKPLPIILEAIHISATRAPPVELQRASASSWNGVRTPIGLRPELYIPPTKTHYTASRAVRDDSEAAADHQADAMAVDESLG